MNRSIKGLLIKDYNLMKNQGQFFLTVILIGIMFCVTRFSLTFLTGYVTMMFSFFTLSTLSYDEYENGAAYLFTLPVSRKDYVREKYVFGFLVSILPCVVTSAAAYLIETVRGSAPDFLECLSRAAAILVAAVLLQALEIPIYLKFGPEKGRIVRSIPLAAVGVIIMLFARVGDLAGADSIVLINKVQNLGAGIIAAAAAGIVAAFLWISYQISVGIVEKKQF